MPIVTQPPAPTGGATAAGRSTRTLRDAVRDAFLAAVRSAIESGTLPDDPSIPPAAVDVERPANAEHGDFATNVALRLARPLRLPPQKIASAIAESLTAEMASDGPALIASVDVAGPGFINVALADRALERAIAAIRADPAAWGRVAGEA